MNRVACFLLSCLLIVSSFSAGAQKQKGSGIYTDRQGVLRWKANNAEAAFFGVNYTAPFAFSYRAHQALQADLEQAMRQDVYHLARLGFDAFRVHVWDTEISDTAGNLLANDHLRLFDFLVAELKKRGIKQVITPIAFWGNGYPERDEPTPGFSRKYGKGGATVNDTAIKAQENYLKQFFAHVNPYTRLAYKDDPDVVAMEINNEPRHSGPKSGVTAYINRLHAAVLSTGWNKPVFYNISENPFYAGATAASGVDGFSMQWYPVGLVAGHTLGGNFLPHVDRYTFPFDTIPRFNRRPLMVYEFDAADVLKPYLYPAIARSFKGAGFQWATQFAYDPMAIANVNTEYQTHYVNLAYTPAKAISLMIAAEVFRRVPRGKKYGTYPADTLFDVFRVSYKEGLSEMNAPDKFYYSGSTGTLPKEIRKLQKVAGVGYSPVVRYSGSGAYFLDRLQEGVWRLEVMPDALLLRDPFEKASPRKEVARVQWQRQSMKLLLPGLDGGLVITPLNEGNSYGAKAEEGQFFIFPGTYLVRNASVPESALSFPDHHTVGGIGLREFVAPPARPAEVWVSHQPPPELSAGKPYTLEAVVAGADTAARVSVQLNRLGGGWQSRSLEMKRGADGRYRAEVPADFVLPGQMSYNIVVQQGPAGYTVFPGGHKGAPFAWDNFNNDRWTTFVAAEKGRLSLFNPNDQKHLILFPSGQKDYQASYTASEKPGQLVLRLTAARLTGDRLMGLQHYFGDGVEGRKGEMTSFDRLVVRARASNGATGAAKVSLITTGAAAFSADISLAGQWQDIAVPLARLKPDSFLLLPRPYPQFLPLRFSAGAAGTLDIREAERLEITVGRGVAPLEDDRPYAIEIEAVWLE